MLPNETLDAVTKGREGFNYTEDGEFQGASGREAVDLFILHSLVSYLRLEIKTGMKMTARASTLAKANEVLGTNYKRKDKALAHLEQVLELAGELKPKTGEEE
jgi:hypothetical protein